MPQQTFDVERDVHTTTAVPTNALSQMYRDPALRKLCDVTFIVDAVAYPAHRVVVAAASPVFKAMLTNGMRETQAGEIPLQSTDKTTWEIALRYMYIGTVELQSEEIARNVVQLAHQFEINALQEAAEAYLCNHVSSDNVFSIHRFAEEYGLSKLRLNCSGKLGKELVSAKKNPDFKLFSFDAIDEILGKYSSVLGMDVFRTICFWANIRNIDDVEVDGNVGDPKYEEAKKLCRNLNVEEMEASEIEILWKYKFVRDCPDIVDSCMKRALLFSGIGTCKKCKRQVERCRKQIRCCL